MQNTKHQDEITYYPYLHRDGLCRGRQSFQRERDGKEVDEAQGYGKLLWRRYDQDNLGENEEGRCKMYWSRHARNRPPNIQVSFLEIILKSTFQLLVKLQFCNNLILLIYIFIRSPHRVVHALLESAEDHEQMKVLKAMQGLHQTQSSSSNNPTLQLVLGGQQQAPAKGDIFKKMMMKMLMKKLFKEDNESPFGSIGGNEDNKGFDLLKLLSQQNG